MAEPLDYRRPDARLASPARPRGCAIALAVVLVLAVLVPALLHLAMWLAFRDTGRSVSGPDTAWSVAADLGSWPIFPQQRSPGEAIDALRGRITGVRGYSVSGGIHGDGTDWYEVDLPPSLANELRTSVNGSPAVKKSKEFPRGTDAPSWWPTTWPADAQCYEFELGYLVLPDTGTRAWFHKIRM